VIGSRTKSSFSILFLCAVIAVFAASPVWLFAAASGSVSGTVNDPTNAVIPGATVTLVNTAVHAKYKAISNEQGFYSFPALPAGHYDLTIEAEGFKPEKRPNVTVDTDSAVQVDAVLALPRNRRALVSKPAASRFRCKSTPWQRTSEKLSAVRR